MTYLCTADCVADLERQGELRRINIPIDGYLEAAAIHRRTYAAGGPALLFANLKGCRFPAVSNLFGTFSRARWIFRDTYAQVQKLIDLKVDPTRALRQPLKYALSPITALRMLPRYAWRGPVLANQCKLTDLPQITCWPKDGGPFVTLPQVYTEDVRKPGLMNSNLGMYRVQLAGNEYQRDQQIGLHYQIHRSIGVHQAAAERAGRPFDVNIFVGGPPAMTLAAVMPLPEGMSELTFAGALTGRRIRMVRRKEGLPVHADADFALCGRLVPGTLLPEGPFGDHLGYYSLQHPFPVLQVQAVYHRTNAIWPFTVVGRPPQEDTAFGELIHDLTGPVIPTVLPGVKGVHAVDAAGVHPLLLAIGSERYMPFLKSPRPQELLTQASAILGQGQLSLAKFLLIVAEQDDPHLDVSDERALFAHLLKRIDWTRDLHFQTETTIDTLDYSGSGFNAGSKLVIAAVGPPRFALATHIEGSVTLPDGFSDPHVVAPGIVAVRGPKCPAPSFDYDAVRRGDDSGEGMESKAVGEVSTKSQAEVERFCSALPKESALRAFRLIIVADDPAFIGASFENFLWATFTRANPAADVHGVDAFTHHKHWGCRGPLVIDARIKPHHAPVLEEDPAVTRRIETLAANDGPLAGLW